MGQYRFRGNGNESTPDVKSESVGVGYKGDPGSLHPAAWREDVACAGCC